LLVVVRRAFQGALRWRGLAYVHRVNDLFAVDGVRQTDVKSLFWKISRIALSYGSGCVDDDAIAARVHEIKEVVIALRLIVKSTALLGRALKWRIWKSISPFVALSSIAARPRTRCKPRSMWDTVDPASP
jgi:hypothetical protein